MISDERLFRNEDGDIVADGDPDAKFLVVGEGCEVEPEDEEAVSAFLGGSKKKKAPAENKKAPASENKSAD